MAPKAWEGGRAPGQQHEEPCCSSEIHLFGGRALALPLLGKGCRYLESVLLLGTCVDSTTVWELPYHQRSSEKRTALFSLSLSLSLSLSPLSPPGPGVDTALAGGRGERERQKYYTNPEILHLSRSSTPIRARAVNFRSRGRSSAPRTLLATVAPRPPTPPPSWPPPLPPVPRACDSPSTHRQHRPSWRPSRVTSAARRGGSRHSCVGPGDARPC